MNLPIIEYQDNETVFNEVDVADKSGRLATREKIELFEDILKKLAGSEHGERDEINNNGLVEYMVEDVYIRQLFIPKDKFVVSKIWKKERFWIICSGEVTFTTEMGTQRIKGPYTKIVPPGSKVAFYTHEDTLWFAIAGCKTKELSEIEDEVTTSKYEDCTYPWDLIEDK